MKSFAMGIGAKTVLVFADEHEFWRSVTPAQPILLQTVMLNAVKHPALVGNSVSY